MNSALLLVTFLGAMNPARLRLALPEDRGSGRARWDVLGAGSLLLFGVGVALVAVSSRLLEALDISPETFRIAAGIVLGASGLWALVQPPPSAELVATGWRAALVPVAFPLLLSPEFAVLMITAGSLESDGATLGALAITLVVLNLAGPVLTGGRAVSRLWLAGSRLLGAALVVGAVALVIDGIRDV
ncbi:MAG: hypothetical protein ACE5KX_00515 [Acidimicrobiia bacterium]